MTDKGQVAVVPKTTKAWRRYLLVILLIEKVIQHVIVTASFFYNISDIRSTVAIDYRILMISGAIIAVLFLIAALGTVFNRRWGIILASALATFDIIGEFIAQGTISIAITVSILVAVTILILCYLEYPSFSTE
jgi:ABC-type sulfate transport system permease subunit